MIAAIDVGWRNLAVCFMSIESGSFYAKRIDIVKSYNNGKFEERLIVEYINNMISENEESFSKCTLVAVEQQMKRKCLIIQHVLKTFFLSRKQACTFISPRSVRSYFKISTGNYSHNKELSIKKVRQLLPSSVFKNQVQIHKKQDDIADAILIAMYTRYNYEKIVKKIIT